MALVFASFTSVALATVLTITSLFLILLVLIQQGKGGGLSGAFGGGGSTAFGTKAGDVFTRVTVVTALVWIFFCMLTIKLMSGPVSKFSGDAPKATPVAPAEDSKSDTKTDAPKTDATKTDTKPLENVQKAAPGDATVTVPAGPVEPSPVAPATEVVPKSTDPAPRL
ncbi:MAG: preprotein translocase subunit SecG [Pirellulales bacterium]